MVIGMVVSPIVALVALGVSAGAPFVLTAIGLGLTVAGPLLVSNRLAEPNYDVMLAWDPDSMPAGWKATRTRYFARQLDPRRSNLGRVCALPRRASDGNAHAGLTKPWTAASPRRCRYRPNTPPARQERRCRSTEPPFGPLAM